LGGSEHHFFAHETTNGTTWQLGFTSARLTALIGDRLYFVAGEYYGDDESIWVYDATNDSTWMVHQIQPYVWITMGTRIYFMGPYGCGVSEGSLANLCVHDTVNESTWVVNDTYGNESFHGSYSMAVLGSRIYFIGTDGSLKCSGGGDRNQELWVHQTTNESTWEISDIDSRTGDLVPGRNYSILDCDLNDFWGVYSLTYGGHFAEIASRIYFAAYDGTHGLWMLELDSTD
jgi:hypothetical protein